MAKGDTAGKARGKRATPRSGKPAGKTPNTGDLVQLLTPDGDRIDKVTWIDGTEYRVDFTDEEYRGLYRDLVLVRRLDAEATALQRQGELGIWASLLGQEAAQVGSGRALRPQDMAFPTYREHGVLYCRGIDPIMPFGLFRGVDLGGWDPNEFKFNMYTIVIGAQTLHATGYAMGVAMDGRTGGDDGEAVIAYFGDGASAQGDVNEAFIWSAVFNAPIVFFCQNNQYAISEPLERQTRIPLYQRAAGFGFPGVRVDGNDVLATYAVTRAALDNARHGQGPTLVEAFTYRMGAHTTTDDPTRYRIASEVEAWQAKDPIARVKAFLTKQRIADDAFFAEVDEQAKQEALRLRERVLEMPDPKPLSLFDHVYPHGSPEIDAQRDFMARYLDSFEGSVH
ncbi:pyruvate dehydrogenase (acetyl-transferring) E1 component subunit alpha [Micromonospora sp. HM5-17]|jgi:pyruvate dehydrogenase E1 component alpha subunit|uniref:pyruvate dehydrogenase (acetyl-transferring) E1 component subunit alpha n=1 Tax=Micromonospora sp. HM5-17 TaxID=2487710 RepID=UPI000F47D16C|nr:pyruvate dehydrogenase (acetyl-transferring) E1 component subunit alpha [Micromonospora sp. HM5-17]ROT33731.1 pyruvate dehydrogenase (acetyl-transferring) E1 component subunit alpha [Micromonospora sp. HM5-17]